MGTTHNVAMIHNSNLFVKKSEIPKTCHNNMSTAGKSNSSNSNSKSKKKTKKTMA